jgi:hypothetical protein
VCRSLVERPSECARNGSALGRSGGTAGSEDLLCKAELGGRTVKDDNRCDLANYVDDFV